MDKKPKPRYKRQFRILMISWLIIFIVGGTLGLVAGHGFFSAEKVQETANVSHETIQQIEPNPTEEPLPMYGTRDGRMFTDTEVSMDWGGELTFEAIADVPLDADLQEFIYYLSYGYYIDYSFVLGLIQTESTYRTDVVSASNDYGLMQINIQNHAWLQETLGITDFLDPEQNIRAGLYILRNLFEKYDDPHKVLMAYNLGEGGAGRLWEAGVYSTSYSNKVLNYAEEIQERIEHND